MPGWRYKKKSELKEENAMLNERLNQYQDEKRQIEKQSEDNWREENEKLENYGHFLKTYEQFMVKMSLISNIFSVCTPSRFGFVYHKDNQKFS